MIYDQASNLPDLCLAIKACHVNVATCAEGGQGAQRDWVQPKDGISRVKAPPLRSPGSDETAWRRDKSGLQAVARHTSGLQILQRLPQGCGKRRSIPDGTRQTQMNARLNCNFKGLPACARWD